MPGPGFCGPPGCCNPATALIVRTCIFIFTKSTTAYGRAGSGWIIVFATRTPEEYGLKNLKDLISYGGSPRASINLAMAAKAYAFIRRRGYVIPEDVRAVCYEVLRHRIGLTYEAEAENVTTENIITEIMNAIEVP